MRAGVDALANVVEQIDTRVDGVDGQVGNLASRVGVVEASSRHDVANVISDLQSASNSAKQEGRNRVHCYREAQDGEHSGLLAIGARVDDIVEREELSLRLQQIAPLAVDSHELPHYELLLVMTAVWNAMTLRALIVRDKGFEQFSQELAQQPPPPEQPPTQH